MCTVVKDNYGDNKTSKSDGLIKEALENALAAYVIFQVFAANALRTPLTLHGLCFTVSMLASTEKNNLYCK